MTDARNVNKCLVLSSLWAVVLLLALFLQGVNGSQPVEHSWNNTFGELGDDNGWSVLECDDGYIIVGDKESGSRDSDICLIKTDKTGKQLAVTVFSTDGNDTGYSIQKTKDNGYIIVGKTDSSASKDDVWLIKTDASGNEKWSKTFGGSSIDVGYSVQEIESGYIIAGWTKSYGSGNFDVWLIKTNTDGNKVWDKPFGGPKADRGHSVLDTKDGYVIVGSTKSYGAGFDDVWLIKTDSKGNEEWSRTFGASGTDIGYSVQKTNDDGYIIVGATNSYSLTNKLDVWLIKTDSEGNETWNKTFGGSHADLGHAVQQTDDGGYIITGYTRSFGAGLEDVWLIKTDRTGDLEWYRTFGGPASDKGRSVQETDDNGYVIVGVTESHGIGKQDVWLIKAR